MFQIKNHSNGILNAVPLPIKDKANGSSLIIDLLLMFFPKLFKEIAIKFMWVVLMRWK